MQIPAEDLQHVLSHTHELWEGLRGNRLFITGGTGFFGCWLLESFLAANEALSLGAEAVVLTRNPDRFLAKAPHLATHPAIKLLCGDVADFVFPEGDFSHIIHAAATSGAPVSDEETIQTIVRGTERMFEFAALAKARQFLFISSGAVYGKQPPQILLVPETYTPAPGTVLRHSVYAEGKRIAEQLCVATNGQAGLEIKIARCFAFVGPHLPLDAHFAIGNFLRDALAGDPIFVNGDGTPLRSYLYASDLAIWLWSILFRGTPGRAYNVGSPQEVSIRDLAEQIAARFSVPVSVLLTAPMEALPARYVPNTNRALAELGLEVWVPLNEAIEKTALWHQNAAAK